MRDLVRDHRSQFGFALRGGHQPGVHADESAGQCERIDHAIVHHEEFECDPGVRAVGGEPVAEVRQVGVEFGVVEEAAVVAHLAHHLDADLALLCHGQHAARCIAQVGQFAGTGQWYRDRSRQRAGSQHTQRTRAGCAGRVHRELRAAGAETHGVIIKSLSFRGWALRYPPASPVDVIRRSIAEIRCRSCP
jgi:hypothetical protein